MVNYGFSRISLNEKRPLFKEREIIFRQLEDKDIDPLITAGFSHHKSRLKQSLINKIFQRLRFKPFVMGLVAYHTQEKQAIGFLQLNRHSKWLYSIKFAFTNPAFRKKGVGSGLFNFAFSQARAKGGRKIFLNVDPILTSSINLYKKLGFNILDKRYEVWARILNPNSVIQHERYVNPVNINFTLSRNHLLSVWKRCVSHEWIGFFETNCNSLIHGFSGDFRHGFLKKAFVNNSKNSFALVFKRPILKNMLVELFVPNDLELLHMLNGLIRMFQNKGLTEIDLKVFNVKNDSCIQLLKEKGFYVYHSLCMGKSL